MSMIMKIEDLSMVTGGEGPQYTNGGLSAEQRKDLKAARRSLAVRRRNHPLEFDDGLVCMRQSSVEYIDVGFKGPTIG